MEGSRADSDQIEQHRPEITHGVLYVGVGRHAVAQVAFGVEMPTDEDEGDNSGPALQDIEPVCHPGMTDRVRFALPPDVHAVKAVEEERNPENGGFDENSPGD